MADTISGHAHLIAGGFPPGSYAGHDHDYARLRLLGLLAERDIPASVANDFVDDVRNGILHQAQSRRFAIWRDEPPGRILTDLGGRRYALNRTEFYQALKTEFSLYLEELRDSSDPAVRSRFIEEMDRIAKHC